MRLLLCSLLSLALLLPGCVITHSPGFHSGYRRLPAAEQEKIRFLPAHAPWPATADGYLYAVTAQSLLQALPVGETTLVYLWAPHCHGRGCASLQGVEADCRRQGYRFQAVAEYYADLAQIKLQPPLQRPLLAINHPYYRSDYCQKYARLFQAELRQGQPLPDSLEHARYYVFQGRTFVRALNALPGVPPQFQPTAPLRSFH
ncbi:hypothetical protein Q5H92_10605 [Hymenobacter sp. M29]|uniref:Uncharacterized protein n=1 Tax=Hymenobacter mellowenesis TaxID=3063995 RepID=A0ABT9AAE5_9BACT|nr:hypothetical protein [Hymenobacter sp. M29]MDO7846808.1 hypothetical protein [Hymenobacter sp. M29]